MFSLLKRLATVPILLGSLAIWGLLLLLIALKVPDKLARAMGYTGEQTVFALDEHPYTPEATYELLIYSVKQTKEVLVCSLGLSVSRLFLSA